MRIRKRAILIALCLGVVANWLVAHAVIYLLDPVGLAHRAVPALAPFRLRLSLPPTAGPDEINRLLFENSNAGLVVSKLAELGANQLGFDVDAALAEPYTSEGSCYLIADPGWEIRTQRVRRERVESTVTQPVLLSDGSSGTQTTQITHSLLFVVATAGWPLPAVQSAFVSQDELVEQQMSMSRDEEHLKSSSSIKTAFTRQTELTEPLYIPLGLRPIVLDNRPGSLGAPSMWLSFGVRPVGFALNTLMYAVLFWLTGHAFFILRTRRRINRGLCPSCAYDIRGVETCPECGRVLKAG